MAHLLQLFCGMDLKLGERMAELKRQWNSARRHHPRLVLGVAASLLLFAAIVTVSGVLFLASLRDGLPDQAAMRRIGEMDQATAVFDENDRLAFTIFKEQRIDVPLSQVSPNLTKAITAIEDQRFFEHHGFDLFRIVSAAAANVRHNRRVQGGSTITQQLARQSFLTPNKSYRRKLQELILAARLERLYTKQQILELYFNKVYFGDGLYGVEAASRGFFGKHASQVTVAEAALLAGLVKSPSSYAPTVSLERAVARRNTVLQAMLDAGAIDRATFQSARANKPALHDTLREEEPHGQYFKEQVRQELVNRFGWQRVYQGGLRVFSTIDMPMQIAAETAIADQIKSIEGRRAAWQARRAAAREKSGKSPAPRRSVRGVAGGADRARTGYRPGARDGRRTRFRRQPLQSRRSSASSSGLGVQTVRLCGGARGRLHTCDRARPPRRSHRHAARRVDAGGRALGGSDDEPAHRPAHVEQSRGGQAAAASGHPAHRAVRQDDGRRRCSERAVAGAGVGRGHAPADDGRVRGLRQSRTGSRSAV